MQFPAMTMDICGGRGEIEKITVFSLCDEKRNESIEDEQS